jgi:phosphoribosylformimino-5-aminoimidazole carboxamide ribotide isomerase
MIAMPAVDLREGACVQLVGGSYARERIRLEDPVAVAQQWIAHGFRQLHVVDLDGATERGSNRATVLEILRRIGPGVQIGGGIRTGDDIRTLLDAGADRVVVGTRALADRPWLERTAATYPGRLVLAADVRGRRVVTRGWSETLAGDVLELLAGLNGIPLAGVLVTAVHNEGRLLGADLPLFREVVRVLVHPVYASGGVASRDDLDGLARAGCHAAVLGMALYTGRFDPRTIAGEFAA